jgi:hypothetical protein
MALLSAPVTAVLHRQLQPVLLKLMSLSAISLMPQMITQRQARTKVQTRAKMPCAHLPRTLRVNRLIRLINGGRLNVWWRLDGQNKPLPSLWH